MLAEKPVTATTSAKFFAELVRSKQLIHPHMVWKVASKIQKMPDHQCLLKQVVDVTIRTSDYALLDVMLQMRDFSMYASIKPAKRSILCGIWDDNVPFETFCSFTEFVITKHKFNLNKSPDFCLNLLNIIQHHANYVAALPEVETTK